MEKIDGHDQTIYQCTLDHDRIDAELAVKLLTGNVSERDVALDGLAAYLHKHCNW